MADYRTIQSKIYRDDWFSQQLPDAKLLFIYLFTNTAASVAGIYELPARFMAFETGITEPRVRELLADFQKVGKIEWCDPVVWVKKMREYQATNSPKVAVRIAKDLQGIPDCDVKRHYLKGYSDTSDTVSIGYPESGSETDTDTDTKQTIGADAPPVALPERTNGHQPTERQAAIKELETAFIQATKLPAPKRDTDKQKKAGAELWWTPLGELYDLVEHDVGRAKGLVAKSIQKLRTDQMTFDSPKSLMKTARSIHANGSQQVPTRKMRDADGN